MTYSALMDEIKKLAPKERLELIDEIYDTLDDNDAAFALTNEQKAELDRRFEYYKTHPEEMIPIEQFEAELKSRNEKR